MKIPIIILLVTLPICCMSQHSISENDIEVNTQLTLLTIEPDDADEFEKNMKSVATLAKKINLGEALDWLVYTSDSNDYLIVNFSIGIHDVLTLNDYKVEFNRHNVGKEFNQAMESINKLGVSFNKNYVKEMLLPWSTVKQISVSEFPRAKMVEYKIAANKLNTFDNEIRKLVRMLKETNYPYPLEGSRGSVGAYGKVTLVWFYEDRAKYEGDNNLINWVTRHNRTDELKAILDEIGRISQSKEIYNFSYKKELSY